MPYQIRSDCPACRQTDVFLIGNWPEHLGVFACTACRALVNVPVADGKCPGCGRQPGPHEFLDYADSAPYLGRSFHKKLAAGPRCPKCGRDFVLFTNTRHLNMLAVVGNRAGAEAAKGQEYMEKALFRNSLAPVIAEFRLDAAKVFAYFHLEPRRDRPLVPAPRHGRPNAFRHPPGDGPGEVWLPVGSR
jgi:hypothetical protein